LIVDGKRYERTLTLAPDPRIDLPATAYAEQFALAREIEASRAAIASAAAQAGTVLKGVAERRKAASNEVVAALDEFEGRVRNVTGTAASSNPVNAWWRPARSLQSLRYCGETLERLQEMVELADAAPSPDVRTGFAKLKPASESVIADWRGIAERELPVLNDKLQAAGLEPIPLEQKQPTAG
jgi:hypothetical protein